VKYDALVIGGGPAGATVAQMLARAGWSVGVVEKSSFPRRKVCGEFVSATSMPLFDELGIGGAFRAAAGPEIRRVGLFSGEAMLASAMPRISRAQAICGRALGREWLDTYLLEAAVQAGARLWQPWKVVGLQRGQDGFTCEIEAKGSMKKLSARVVIAAHGSWERNALRPQHDKAHQPSDLLAFKAHFHDGDLASDLMPLLVFPGGYGGMVTSDDGRVSLSCCIRRDELARCRLRYPGPHAGEAVLAHIQESCAGVRNALRHARIDGAWHAAGPIRPGIRERYADGLFFVGNVAGEAHPIVAEGISMAIQSAWLLAGRMIACQEDATAGRTLADIGQDYAAEWDACFAPRIRAAALFAHLAMRPMAVALLLPVLRQFPRILTMGAELSGKSRQVIAA
jgi:flavin-dependent dehydrogenase